MLQQNGTNPDPTMYWKGQMTFFYITIPFTIIPILLPLSLWFRRDYLPLRVHGVIPLTIKCIAAFLYFVVILLVNALGDPVPVNGQKRDAREMIFSFGCVFLPFFYLYPFFLNCYSVNITFLLNYWKARLLETQDETIQTKIQKRIRLYSLALDWKSYILPAIFLILALMNLYLINIIFIFTTEDQEVIFFGIISVIFIGFFFACTIGVLIVLIRVNKVQERFFLRVTLLANLMHVLVLILIAGADGIIFLSTSAASWRQIVIGVGFVCVHVTLTWDLLLTVAMPIIFTFTWKKKNITQSDLTNLRWILDNPYFFSLFREYSVSEWASEYVDFYKVVASWDKLIEKGNTIQSRAIISLANEIFHTFIVQDGPLALNLSGHQVKLVEEALQLQHLQTFKNHIDTVLREIVIPQLEDIFSRFKTTSKFTEHKLVELVQSDVSTSL